jgi:hypothetical protein
MTDIEVAGKAWLRLYEIDGVPGSGANEPAKLEGQALFAAIEADKLALNAKVDNLAITGGVLISAATWAALSAVVGTIVGQAAEVPATDAGTHTDPVVGGTKANAGRYAWSASPAGWKWISADAYSTKANIASPTFTGTPSLTTTPPLGDNSHKLADTAFVDRIAQRVSIAERNIIENSMKVALPPVEAYRSGYAMTPSPVTSTFIGWAVPFLYDATYAFDTVKAAYFIEFPGQAIFIEIWDGNQTTRYARGQATPIEQDGELVVKLDTRITTGLTGGARNLYVAMYCPISRLQQHQVAGFVDVADPVTYPQKYITSMTWATLADWTVVTGSGPNGTGRPIAFGIFDSLRQSKAVKHGPHADQVIFAPKFYGAVGVEQSIYFDDLRSGQSKRLWKASSSVLPSSKQQDERWTLTSGVAYTNQAVTIDCIHPDTLEILGTATIQAQCETMTLAAGATRRVMPIGDSLTAGGNWQQRALDIATANASAAHPTFVGTKGAGSNKHEGISGWTAALFFEPGSLFATNPFTQTSSSRFNAAYYIASTGIAAPAIVSWCLGVNDVFGADSDLNAHLAMDNYLHYLDCMIGILDDVGVTSWWEVNPTIKHMVCVPPAPAFHQDAFGAAYNVAYARARYFRNIAIAQYRIIDHYKNSQPIGVHLVPWNAVVDPVNGFAYDAFAPANVDTARTVERQNNSVHPPATGLGGYQQMGDAWFAAFNVLVARGSI